MLLCFCYEILGVPLTILIGGFHCELTIAHAYGKFVGHTGYEADWSGDLTMCQAPLALLIKKKKFINPVCEIMDIEVLKVTCKQTNIQQASL